MSRRTYTLADAYLALHGTEALGAIATALREGLADQDFLNALADRLSPLAYGETGDFQLVLVKRANGQPVSSARIRDKALKLAVRERILDARERGEDIEAVVADIMQKTGRGRSWVFKVAE